MEVKAESKIGQLNTPTETVYGFVADCTHFDTMAQSSQVKGWSSDADSCRFSLDMVGQLSFRVVERQENKLVKFAIESTQATDMFLWVQMMSGGAGNTRIKLTTKMDVNPMLKMLIAKPLKNALDKVVDTLEQYYKQ